MRWRCRTVSHSSKVLNANSAPRSASASGTLGSTPSSSSLAGARGGCRNRPRGWRSWTRSSGTVCARDAGRLGDIVDAHLGETLGGEQLDGDVGDVLRCRRAARAHPRLRHHRTRSLPLRHSMPYCVQNGPSFVESPEERQLTWTTRPIPTPNLSPNPGRRGVHRRNVRGLLTVPVPAPGSTGRDLIRSRSRLAVAPAGGGSTGTVWRTAVSLRHPQAVLPEEPHHP